MIGESWARLARIALVALGVSAAPITVMAFRSDGAAREKAAAVADAQFRASIDTISEAGRVARRASVLRHDPFRRSRTPPSIPYNAVAVGQAPQAAAAPQAPRPALSLTGIVWGNRPAALVEGIPGQEAARLLRPGDTAGGIRLRTLTRTRALLVGFDTTWALVIREPWK